MFERSSGILFHPTSLPGKYGIGSLGKEVFDFVNFLKKSKQKLWQIFPLGPTGYGDSPYQSFSSFAGNPYLIDFDLLIEAHLLSEDDLNGVFFGDNEEYIEIETVHIGFPYNLFSNSKENKKMYFMLKKKLDSSNIIKGYEFYNKDIETMTIKM